MYTMMSFKEFLALEMSFHSDSQLDERIDETGKLFPQFIPDPEGTKAEVNKNAALAKIIFAKTGKSYMIELVPRLRGVVTTSDGSTGDTIRGIFRPDGTGTKLETVTIMFRGHNQGATAKQPVDVEMRYHELQGAIKAEKAMLTSPEGQAALTAAGLNSSVIPPDPVAVTPNPKKAAKKAAAAAAAATPKKLSAAEMINQAPMGLKSKLEKFLKDVEELVGSLGKELSDDEKALVIQSYNQGQKDVDTVATKFIETRSYSFRNFLICRESMGHRGVLRGQTAGNESHPRLPWSQGK
jgi:hypothetical protein